MANGGVKIEGLPPTGKKMYEESPGNTSASRVALIAGLVMGFILAGLVIWTKWEAGIFLPIAAWGIPTTGKTVEKFKANVQ